MAMPRYLFADNMEIVICKQSSITYGWHNHISCFTIGFVHDGSVELSTDRSIASCHKNDMFFVPPYIPHRISAKSQYTLLTLCVNKKIIDNAEFINYRPYMEKFLHEAINEPDIESRFIETVNTIVSVMKILPSPVKSCLDKLRNMLEEYPENRFSVDAMAEISNINKYTLIRLFKHEFGLTPHQFLIQNRIRKAKKLLAESRTITEVAMATGFCDQSHFIRHFERILGITPAEYKLACHVSPPVHICC